MSEFLGQGSNFEKEGDSEQLEVSQEFLSLLEATVLAAGKYVVPSDDLRPHTLEAAKELDSDRKGSQHLVGIASVLALCVCIGLPLAGRLSPWREKGFAPSARQLQEMANKRSVGPDWGLLEVLSEQRQKQSEQLRGHEGE